jgi:two-component system chemotaxis sensor kinase CheA
VANDFTNDKEFLVLFFEEAKDNLELYESSLMSIDPGNPASMREHIDAIFRSIHSIKGNAGSINFPEIVDTTHSLEDLLQRVRDGRLSISDHGRLLMQQIGDKIRVQVECREHKKPIPAELTTEIHTMIDALESLCVSGDGALPETGARGAARTVEIHFFPTDSNMDNLLSGLSSVGDLVVHTLGATQQDGDKKFAFPAHVSLTTEMSEEEILEHFAFTLPRQAVQITQKSQVKAEPMPRAKADVDQRANKAMLDFSTVVAEPATTLRVSLVKVDSLVSLAGELVIGNSMLNQTVSKLEPLAQEKLANDLRVIDRHVRTLQDAVMSVRMVPVSTVFNKFSRIAQDLGTRLGKHVTIRMSGENTELDKGMIDKILDPISHMIRNAVDHGIETPAERVAANKPEVGVITLTAAQKDNGILIEVADDGHGMSTQAILDKARSQGLPVRDNMSEAEIFDIIFLPGFSTAKEVTDVSGRGVGMDVVKRNIDSIDGRISVASVPGSGTRISIHLPLTLAVVDGLSVLAGDTTVIVPMSSVVRSMVGRSSDIRKVLGSRSVVKVEGKYVPIVNLAKLMQRPAQVTDPAEGVLIAIRSSGKTVALLVDEMRDQHQLVVKGTEKNMGRSPFVSSATVMGDGLPIMILDGEKVVRHVSEAAALKVPAPPAAASPAGHVH